MAWASVSNYKKLTHICAKNIKPSAKHKPRQSNFSSFKVIKLKKQIISQIFAGIVFELNKYFVEKINNFDKKISFI